MKLNKVEIENFRSVKKETIDFKEFPCRILIGKNETGKSNVLKAIGTLSDSYNMAQCAPDKRIPEDEEEDFSKEHCVKFFFNLEEREIQPLFTELASLFGCRDMSKSKIFQCGDETYTLLEMLQLESRARRDVNLKTLKKTTISSGFNTDNYSILGHWKRIPDNMPNISVDGKNITKGNLKYINTKNYPDQTNSFIDIDIEEFEREFDTRIKKVVDENIPEVTFWQTISDQQFYSDINIDNFIADPKQYPHFKNMCLLVTDIFQDEESIKRVFQEKKQINQLGVLYKKIGTAATKYLKRIWVDFKKENIVLDSSRANLISISVEADASGEKNGNLIPSSYRSDGFKKFLKLMLSLSLKVNAKEITNTIILIDEAETLLHPSSAECFRDELIKLSSLNNNTVVFSTHSPFMIDSNEDNIGRHLIAEKDNETTKLKKGEAGKFFTEQLLWTAIGCGIIRALPDKTIIFEGWDDRVLFKKGLENLEEKEKEHITPGPKSKLSIAHAGGISHIRNVVPAFQAACSQVIVFADSDKAGKDEQNYFKGVHLWGEDTFYTFSDLGGKDNETAEDYVKLDKIKDIAEQIKKKYKFKDDLNLAETSDLRVMSKIKDWIANNGLTEKEEEIKREFKNIIFCSLSKEDIREDFKAILIDLNKKVKKLSKK